jgi:hypothetical protein
MIAGIRTFSISEFEFTETLSSAGRLDLRISMRKADRVSSDAQDAGRLSRLKIVDARHAAGTRRVSATQIAPTSGEVVTEFQSDSSRADSPVRVRYAQPASAVSERHVLVCKNLS